MLTLSSRWLAGLLCGLLASPLSATEAQDPIVVTATRFETSIDTAPVVTEVISRTQLEASGANDLAQALETLTNIHVNDLYGVSGAKSRLDIGGFGPTGALNTLVLINGRRLNDVDLSGANLAAIPLASIVRIEIIHGSATVLYGDNAVGGVINIVTDDGLEATPARIGARAGAFTTQQLWASYQGNTDDGGLFLAADSLQSDGYRDRSAFDHSRFVAQATDTRGDALYGTRVHYSTETLELPGALNEPVYLSQPTSGVATLEQAAEDRYGVEGFLQGEHWAGELAWSRKQQDATIFGPTAADLRTISFTPRYRREVGRQAVVTGIDVYHSTLATHADFGAPNINESETTRKSSAVYLTDRYTLGRGVALDAGLRRQWVRLDIANRNLSTAATNADRRKDGLTAWDLTLSRSFDGGRKVYVRAAESFRFPVLDEIWDYFSGTVDAGLRPQQGHHVEAGAELALGADTRLTANLFRINLIDEIGYDSPSFANTNFDPTRHQGADIGLETRPRPHWTLRVGYLYRDAVFRAGPYRDKQVPEVPRHKLSLGNLWDIGEGQTLNLDVVHTGRRYFGNDFTNIGKQMPAHTLVDAGVTRARGDWTLRAQVRNLTDRKTADSGYYNSFAANPYYYYPLPGRAWSLTVERAFR